MLVGVEFTWISLDKRKGLPLSSTDLEIGSPLVILVTGTHLRITKWEETLEMIWSISPFPR